MALLTEHTVMQISEKRAFASPPSRSQLNITLAANTAVDIDMADLADVKGELPTYINFTALENIYVLWNDTGATVPAASILDGTAPEINPGLRAVAGITEFSIISADAGNVNLSLFKGQ